MICNKIKPNKTLNEAPFSFRSEQNDSSKQRMKALYLKKHGNNFWPSSSNIQFTRLLNLKKDISTKTKKLNFPML